MNRILRVARRKLSCAATGAFQRSLSVKIALAMVAIAAVLPGCDSNSSHNPQLENGWVTNCAGTEFSRFSQDGKTGPGPERPVFKVNDQLVLAIPAKNRPSAGRFDSVPRKCKQIGDLPSVPYLYFVIWGNWSAGYKPEDIPLDGGRKQFLPDAVTVRIERDTFVTSPMEDQDRIARLKKFNDGLLDRQEIGGLTCGRIVRAPHAGKRGALFCSGHRTPSDPDTIKFRTSANENTTPFVWIDAEYRSTQYGGIHVYWQVWTLDLAHAIEIDQAIWRSLLEWNVMEGNDTAFSPR